jgi:hypothetical protein
MGDEPPSRLPARDGAAGKSARESLPLLLAMALLLALLSAGGVIVARRRAASEGLYPGWNRFDGELGNGDQTCARTARPGSCGNMATPGEIDRAAIGFLARSD